MDSKWFPLWVLGAALSGWLLGLYCSDVGWLSSLLSALKTLFLSVLKMIVAPLIFCSVVSGILRLRAAANVRRLGLVTLGFYLTTTAIAIGIGLTVVAWIHPWTAQPPLSGGFNAAPAQLLSAGDGSTSAIVNSLIARLFENPFSALANLNILAIVGNALLIGLAGLLILPKKSIVEDAFSELTALFYRLARWAVLLVPIGVVAIIFEMSRELDAGLLTQLLSFVGVVIAATLLHGLVVLPLLAWLLTGRKPWQLWRAIASPVLVAFSTSSSAATLPVSLRTAEHRLGVRASIASFVLPLGATINMDGTALFEGIAAVFLAYLFGIPLGPAETVVVFVVAMLASVGAPGMPSGSMSGMQVVLLAVGIPLEAIGLLLLVERPLDTIRTAVNVQGDLIASLVAETLMDTSTLPAAHAEEKV
ncbi:MAG: dicarboxylate/amino acid:cation symporter [Pseudomonadales bacterium]